MEEVRSLFDQVPLPFEYAKFPAPDEPRLPKDKEHMFYVNKGVITGLSLRGFLHGGFSRSNTMTRWNTSWGRQYEPPQYQRVKSWQKINHFSGAFLIGRKDDFHARMKELGERMNHWPEFYPETYFLPTDADDFEKVKGSDCKWIFKPAAAARGNGIMIMRIDEETELKRGVYQKYIDIPLLITRRKFDIRLYTLVTSINPLRIYMHQNGMARFATMEYNNSGSLDDLSMHLTNYSVNKESDSFIMAAGKEIVDNSKWSIQFLMEFMEKQGIDTKLLMSNLEKVAITALIAGICKIRETHFQNVRHRHSSYELYGIDILLDENLNPYIMEVNISPSMANDTKLDKSIKWPLMLDALNMARIVMCNPKSQDPCPEINKIDDAWKRCITSREQVEEPWDDPSFAEYVIIRDYIEELPRRGGFRRVYPKKKNMKSFYQYFDKMIYTDRVFNQWIEMDKVQRLKVLQKNWDQYVEKMNEISPPKMENPDT